MLKQVRAALDELTRQYRDSRLYRCQIDVAALDGDRCRLSGTVLDKETCMAVTMALADRFPAKTFDSGDVQVLRPGNPMTVGTNLTSLHAEPSFRSEMVSQLVNGAQVELLLKQDRWAFIRQADGYLGWTYRSYLTPRPAPGPTHIVCEPISLMRETPAMGSRLVSRLVGGTAVRVTALEGSWACLSLAALAPGWVPAGDLRALDGLPKDEDTRRRQIVQDATTLTGVPYLWGACSAMGIDCSALAQLLHRLIGLTIPRDADMQSDAGQPVKSPFKPGDLLFFGGDGESRPITHVGVSVGGWRMVHASRARNGVYEDDVQAVASLRDSFVGACTFLGDSERGVG